MGLRGPPCTICSHSKRAEIEALLAEESLAHVGSKFHVKVGVLEKHRRLHDRLEPGHAPRGGSRPDAPPRPTPEPLPPGASQVDQARAHRRFSQARLRWEAAWGEGRDLGPAAAQVLASLKLETRLTGGFDVTAAQVVKHPEFVKVMGVIFEVLQREGELEVHAELKRVMARLEAGEMPQR